MKLTLFYITLFTSFFVNSQKKQFGIVTNIYATTGVPKSNNPLNNYFEGIDSYALNFSIIPTLSINTSNLWSFDIGLGFQKKGDKSLITPPDPKNPLDTNWYRRKYYYIGCPFSFHIYRKLGEKYSIGLGSNVIYRFNYKTKLFGNFGPLLKINENKFSFSNSLNIKYCLNKHIFLNAFLSYELINLSNIEVEPFFVDRNFLSTGLGVKYIFNP